MPGPSTSPYHLIGSLVGVLMLTSPGAQALNVALTNDDGWSSLGIQSVKTALLAAGHNVVLAGPLDEQSGSSAAINTSGLLVRKEQESAGALEFSVAVSGGTEGAEPAFLRNVNGLLPAGLGLNINYPPVEVPAGVKVVQQGRTAAIGGSTLTLNLGCFVSCASLPVGSSSAGGIKGTALDETPEVRNADTTAYAQGYVTIVPIEGDYTADPVARLHAVIGLKSMFAKRGR